MNLKKYHYYLYKYQAKIHTLITFRKGIKNKIKKYPDFKTSEKDKDYLRKSRQFLSTNFNSSSNTNWHHFYRILGNATQAEYIPCDIFFAEIEPTLNDYRLYQAISDKLSYDLYFKVLELPETLFKKIRDSYYDANNKAVSEAFVFEKLRDSNEIIVLKPGILSGGGKNVFIDNAYKIVDLLRSKPKHLKGSFIIQRFVKQHKDLARFHPNSLNTIRVMSARVDSEIVILSTYLKIGGKNNRNDNVSTGGLIISIKENGKLANYAYTKEKEKVTSHPDTGIQFEGNSIPNYQKVIDFCTKYHQRFLRFTFISWDIAINEEGNPVFVEFNLRKQTIHGHQIINGPLFGKHTEYFIQKYKEEKEKDLFYN